MSSQQTNPPQPVVIRKYANRRLYNTQSSQYVTFDDLRVMIRNEVPFVVQDKAKNDVTRQTLAQILLEQETKQSQNNDPVLSSSFLENILRYQQSALNSVLPSFLETSLAAFNRESSQIAQNLNGNDLHSLMRNIAQQNVNFVGRLAHAFSLPTNTSTSQPSQNLAEENAQLKQEIQSLKTQLQYPAQPPK